MQQEKIPAVIITGAGPGGLSLYHALIKNKDKKEFNVKIFEREAGPKDRWQGYHIGLNSNGIRSLMKCVPASVASNLPKAMPNPIPGVEHHGVLICDHTGDLLFKPPFKQVKDVYEIEKNPKHFFSAIMAYRDRFRDVLLEGVPVQWGKKCIGYEETKEGVWVFFDDGSREFCDILVGADGINSPVRKQKIPELQIHDFGITQVNANAAVPKHIMDKLIKIGGNSLIQQIVGLNGDTTFIAFRLIPIEDNKNKYNEPHYRTTLIYAYLSELDHAESEKTKIDDNDPASVIEHVKYMIRKLRPKCEMTDVLLELWDLVPKTTPNDPENFPFKTYNPIQRRKLQDFDPLSVKSWTSSRVTLLGDAAHAMSPILGLGTTNAIQDADILSQALLNYSPENYISCIKEYESEMLKRSSADVLRARAVTFNQITPVGYFGFIMRNTILKITNAIVNFRSFVINSIF